jgi:hypothetical protein
MIFSTFLAPVQTARQQLLIIPRLVFIVANPLFVIRVCRQKKIPGIAAPGQQKTSFQY